VEIGGIRFIDNVFKKLINFREVKEEQAFFEKNQVLILLKGRTASIFVLRIFSS
jgi:hypothetical protein